MRNFSMKKFGTPIGAGPGRARLKVGSAAVGAPSGWRVLPLSTLAEPVASLTAPATWSLAPSTLSLALRLAWPVVFWADCCGELVDGAAGWGAAGFWAGSCAGGAGSLLGPVSEGGGVAGACGTSETEAIGVVMPGILIWSIGVPGGTSTVTVSVWPVTSVTSSVRCSADAGMTEAPTPAAKTAQAIRPMISLRLVIRIRTVGSPPLGPAPTHGPERRGR